MKTETIHCDICKRKIDLNADMSLSMYESISIKTTMDLQKVPSKIAYDICKNCAEEVEKLLSDMIKKGSNQQTEKDNS